MEKKVMVKRLGIVIVQDRDERYEGQVQEGQGTVWHIKGRRGNGGQGKGGQVNEGYIKGGQFKERQTKKGQSKEWQGHPQSK